MGHVRQVAVIRPDIQPLQMLKGIRYFSVHVLVQAKAHELAKLLICHVSGRQGETVRESVSLEAVTSLLVPDSVTVLPQLHEPASAQASAFVLLWAEAEDTCILNCT